MTELALVSVEPTLEALVLAVRRAAEGGANTLAVLPEDTLADELFGRLSGIRRAAPAEADILCLAYRRPEALHQALHTQLERTHGTVIIPRLAGHGLNRPLFLISVPKAGTHLLYRLAEVLGYKPGVTCPDIPTPGYWYCLEYSNSHTVPRDFFVDSVRRAPFGNRMHPFPFTPVLFIVRHPWDILVSEANYYAKPGNTIFSGFYDGLDFDARTQRLLEDGAMLGRFCDRVLAFEPWLHFNNVVALAFEDLVGEAGGADASRQQRLIWSVQVKLGVPGSPREIGARLFNKASPTFNEGRIGSHRYALPDAVREHLNSNSANALQAFGYQSGNPYSTYAEAWRQRPLVCQENKFDATPIAEEINYWGHNLVRYRSRFYAVPIALGPVDLTADERRLAGFLSADNLPGLRAAVMTHALTGELRTRLKNLEDLVEERTRRIAALEAAIEGRTQRPRKLGSFFG